MGKPIIRQGSVLYLDLEGTEARTKQRLAKIGYTEMPENLFIQYRKEVKTIDDGFMQQLESWIKDHRDTVLIVVDMWKCVKGTTRLKEDDYTSVNRMLTPIQAMAIENNLCIMITLHTRKQISGISVDDPFNEVIGSTAYFGVADTGWMLLGKRDENRKRFFVLCRDSDEGMTEYAVTFENFRYSIVGTREEVEREEERRNYENNPVVYTLKHLLKEESIWIGTMTELNTKMSMITGDSKSPKSLNQALQKLMYLLWKNDSISIEFPNKNGGSGGRKYKIIKRIPQQLMLTGDPPDLNPDI